MKLMGRGGTGGADMDWKPRGASWWRWQWGGWWWSRWGWGWWSRGTGEWGFSYRTPSLNFHMALMIMQIRPRKPNSDSTEEINLLFNSFLLKRIWCEVLGRVGWKSRIWVGFSAKQPLLLHLLHLLLLLLLHLLLLLLLYLLAHSTRPFSPHTDVSSLKQDQLLTLSFSTINIYISPQTDMKMQLLSFQLKFCHQIGR